jgi:hypothetical protein
LPTGVYRARLAIPVSNLVALCSIIVAPGKIPDRVICASNFFSDKNEYTFVIDLKIASQAYHIRFRHPVKPISADLPALAAPTG